MSPGSQNQSLLKNHSSRGINYSSKEAYAMPTGNVLLSLPL